MKFFLVKQPNLITRVSPTGFLQSYLDAKLKIDVFDVNYGIL